MTTATASDHCPPEREGTVRTDCTVTVTLLCRVTFPWYSFDGKLLEGSWIFIFRVLVDLTWIITGRYSPWELGSEELKEGIFWGLLEKIGRWISAFYGWIRVGANTLSFPYPGRMERWFGGTLDVISLHWGKGKKKRCRCRQNHICLFSGDCLQMSYIKIPDHTGRKDNSHSTAALPPSVIQWTGQISLSKMREEREKRKKKKN